MQSDDKKDLAHLATHWSWQVRGAVARNPRTPRHTLTHLAADTHRDVRVFVSQNSHVSPAALRALLNRPPAQAGDDTTDLIRVNVALHQNLPTDLYPVLAADPDPFVRSNLVAGQKHLPGELLIMLAGDPTDGVRLAVAQHPRTPAAVLTALAEGSHLRVREAVADNPRTPVSTLTVLATDPEGDVRTTVAQHPRTPVAVLFLLSGDTHLPVLRSLTRHPNMPLNLLARLATHPHPDVRDHARNHARYCDLPEETRVEAHLMGFPHTPST